MKRTCALALIASAATVYSKDIMVMQESDANLDATLDVAVDKSEQRWQTLRSVVYFMQQTWGGMYQGLYGPSGASEKMDDDCFGEWMPEDLEFIVDYFHRLGHDFWSITYEDTTELSYDIVDLMFLNDQYCHFRQSLYDVISFCKADDKPCKIGTVL